MAPVLSVLATLALASSVAAVPMNQKRATFSDLSSKIKHVVYLMMENHSFDNIAGYWDFRDDIDNLRNVNYCNEYTNPNWTIYDEPIMICAGPYEQEVPLVDPDHNFAGTSYEIYRTWTPSKDDTPNMGGFIERQSDKYSQSPGDASFVIKAYDAGKGSTLTTLAQNYAFWDTYHAEHPGPTNPNRMFATSGSTCGYVDNTDTQATGWFANVTGTTCATSIFESLSNNNISWKNYYESDIIDSYIYKWVQDNAMDKIVHANEFWEDIANGTLPQFSYINPECCSIDSMHPTSNMAGGELLIKHVYDALRASPYWENT
jgi:phospholipase C